MTLFTVVNRACHFVRPVVSCVEPSLASHCFLISRLLWVYSDCHFFLTVSAVSSRILLQRSFISRQCVCSTNACGCRCVRCRCVCLSVRVLSVRVLPVRVLSVRVHPGAYSLGTCSVGPFSSKGSVRRAVLRACVGLVLDSDPLKAPLFLKSLGSAIAAQRQVRSRHHVHVDLVAGPPSRPLLGGGEETTKAGSHVTTLLFLCRRLLAQMCD